MTGTGPPLPAGASSTGGATGGTGPPRSAGVSPTGGARGGFPCHHDGRPGTLDERARRLPHEELGVALQLVSDGHDVRSLRERPGVESTPDFDVCGNRVEVKSYMALPDRDGGPPTAGSMCNKLLRATRQADVAVVWARASGLDAVEAHRGMRFFAERDGWSKMASVRVLGDDFDLSWGAPLRTLDRPIPAPPARSRHRPVESAPPASPDRAPSPDRPKTPDPAASPDRPKTPDRAASPDRPKTPDRSPSADRPKTPDRAPAPAPTARRSGPPESHRSAERDRSGPAKRDRERDRGMSL